MEDLLLGERKSKAGKSGACGVNMTVLWWIKVCRDAAKRSGRGAAELWVLERENRHFWVRKPSWYSNRSDMWNWNPVCPSSKLYNIHYNSFLSVLQSVYNMHTRSSIHKLQFTEIYFNFLRSEIKTWPWGPSCDYRLCISPFKLI